MEKITIQTSQNIDIAYEVANLGDRYLAGLIDYGIFIGYLMLIGLLIALFGVERILNTHIYAWLVIIFSPIIFYDLFCEIFFEGQSFGKMARKLKVVMLDGSQVPLSSYLLRWLLRIIDISLSTGGVAILSIIVNGKGQRLGDIAAGTTVVNLKKRNQLESDFLAHYTSDDYVVQYPQVTLLTDSDIATIKEVVQMQDQFETNYVTYELYERLKKVLDVENTESADDFFQILIKDYNHLTSR